MSGRRKNHYPTHHGYGDIKLSRYLALYVAQAGWLVLGFYLNAKAFWPSTCTPETVFEIYACSMRLPESHQWTEAALLTWLWATPILVVLELMRRFGPKED